MDVLRRSVRKSRRERIKNEHIKEIVGVKGKEDIMDITENKRLQWCGHVKRMPEERIQNLIMEWTPDRKKKKRTPKKNVDRGGTSSHGNKEFGTRSMEKQRGMAFGLWETRQLL